MPLYEEKLINPLAVRFSQEHIRTTFRDGRVVEPTVDEIVAQPGAGDYDVILRAPFPHIEIIRWRPPCIGDGDEDDAAQTADGMHWFTLDNRRLYCLQRAAVALLPKRAAAVVELLYADDGHVWRKYDTQTCGLSVSISHSTKSAPISHWSWKNTSTACMTQEATSAMRLDDQKTLVDDLQGVAATGADSISILQRFCDALGAEAEKEESEDDSCVKLVLSKPPKHGQNLPSSAPSTADDSSDEAIDSADTTPSSGASCQAQRGTLSALRACLEDAIWTSRKGETYEVTYTDEAYWNCIRKDRLGSKRFTISFDDDSCLVYWGLDAAYYFDASEIERDSSEIRWFAYNDWDKKKARFTWTLAEPRPLHADASIVEKSAVSEASKADTWQADGSYEELEAIALQEIWEQIEDSSFDGRIRLPHWNSFYYYQLGSLRSFVERFPQQFEVTAWDGRQFTVALAAPRSSWRQKAWKKQAYSSCSSYSAAWNGKVYDSRASYDHWTE